MIAVCDHNAAGNVRAVQEAGEAAGLAVLAGMELASVEEVHVVGLFPDADHAERVAAQVRDLLPEADPGYYSFFGEQPLLDADGCRVGTETAALAWATPLELSEAVDLIHRGGRAGRGGAHRPEVVQRVLAAGLRPGGRGLRRPGDLQVAAGGFTAPGGDRASWACRWWALPTPTSWRRSARASPS